jgi:hypothetical protein
VDRPAFLEHSNGTQQVTEVSGAVPPNWRRRALGGAILGEVPMMNAPVGPTALCRVST